MKLLESDISTMVYQNAVFVSRRSAELPDVAAISGKRLWKTEAHPVSADLFGGERGAERMEVASQVAFPIRRCALRNDGFGIFRLPLRVEPGQPAVGRDGKWRAGGDGKFSMIAFR